MKKPKISLDQQKIQAFFLHHIEKILLVIVVGLMLMLILRGLRLPHLDAQMTPQGLVSNSESTKQYVDDPGRWKEVSTQGPRIVNFDVVRQVEKVQLKTEPLAYALTQLGEAAVQPQAWRCVHRGVRIALPQPDLRPLLEPLLAEMLVAADVETTKK